MRMNKKAAWGTIRDLLIALGVILVVLFIILLASGVLQDIMDKIAVTTKYGG